MQSIIELLGANVIGGMIMLIGITLNIQINDAARDIFEDTYQLRNSITAFQIIDYDLHKAGYGVAGEKIVIADSNAFKFKADLQNNGTIRTVYYYVSSDSVMSSTNNPNDKQMLRKIDASNPNTVSTITRLNFAYYDSIGNQISYASLSNAVNRTKIRSIRIYVREEAPEMLNGIYKPIEWRTIIRPTNLL
jgi:hypothetical protein